MKQRYIISTLTAPGRWGGDILILRQVLPDNRERHYSCRPRCENYTAVRSAMLPFQVTPFQRGLAADLFPAVPLWNCNGRPFRLRHQRNTTCHLLWFLLEPVCSHGKCNVAGKAVIIFLGMQHGSLNELCFCRFVYSLNDFSSWNWNDWKMKGRSTCCSGMKKH